MLLVGLTGGIASGKSFVTDCFEKLGAPVIDADLLAREVVRPGSQGLQTLVSHFSNSIITPTGELDRAALRNIVFENPSERKFLDNTLHPLIRKLSNERIDMCRQQAHHYAVYAVPLLVETDQVERFDRIVVVDVPESLQLERLAHRDGGTPQQAKKILDAQATREQRRAVADDVIDNSGSRQSTRTQVAELHKTYTKLAEQRH